MLISLVLANARAVAEVFGAPPVLLLDEVAAHLDGDRRAALYRAVAGLGAQAWMTGTDPELFAGLEDATRLRVEEEGGESKVLAG
jgi:DNA replication and repair protein RecF